MDNVIQLRTIDRKRLDHLQERTETPLTHEDIWYIPDSLGFSGRPMGLEC
jgi:hypothetical protein